MSSKQKPQNCNLIFPPWWIKNGNLKIATSFSLHDKLEVKNLKGVEKRAALIPGQYKKKLADLDKQYHGTTDNQTGPLAQGLQSFRKLETLVIGPWGEGSHGVY